MSDSATNIIKNCPVCGGKAYLYTENDGAYVRCGSCGFESDHGGLASEIIDKWNGNSTNNIKGFDTSILSDWLRSHCNIDGEVNDPVNKPSHYTQGIEVIDVIADYTKNLKGVEAFAAGNAIKYTCRWSYKNGVEDLKKARWYIDFLIERMEDKE